FEAEGTAFQLVAGGRPLSNLNARGLAFLRANKDGLTDLIVSDATNAYLFMNRGTGFEHLPVPALSSVPWNTKDPLVADVSGSGEEEIVYTYNKKAYALALTSAATGLLRAVDDGKGTVLAFGYGRALPRPGVGYRV